MARASEESRLVKPIRDIKVQNDGGSRRMTLNAGFELQLAKNIGHMALLRATATWHQPTPGRGASAPALRFNPSRPAPSSAMSRRCHRRAGILARPLLYSGHRALSWYYLRIPNGCGQRYGSLFSGTSALLRRESFAGWRKPATLGRILYCMALLTDGMCCPGHIAEFEDLSR